jgi:hypothetical protein
MWIHFLRLEMEWLSFIIIKLWLVLEHCMMVYTWLIWCIIYFIYLLVLLLWVLWLFPSVVGTMRFLVCCGTDVWTIFLSQELKGRFMGLNKFQGSGIWNLMELSPLVVLRKMLLINIYIYLKVSGSRYVFLVFYVDILLVANDNELLFETKCVLSSHFNMKYLGEASYGLGIQIFRDKNNGVLELS